MKVWNWSWIWGHAREVSSENKMTLPRMAGMAVVEHLAKPVSWREPVRLDAVDKTLLWAMTTMLLWGVVMVYSASIALTDNPRYQNYAEYHFVLRHCMAIGVGTVLGLIAFRVPMEVWQRWAPWIFIIALTLLVLVLVPGVGKSVNGARRWIPLGIINFQPSELIKLGMLFYAADYMVRKMDVQNHFVRHVAPMATAVGLVGVLLLLEPDMGAFMVVVFIAMGVLFLGGVKARMFFLIAIIMVLAFVLMIYLSPWRRERIFAYLDPWNPEYSEGKGYQLINSLIAFGRGEVFGVGLGGSVEKLHWLPEVHTDFLLAVIGEELGLVGVLILGWLFFWMTRRIMLIGRQAVTLDRVFSGLVAQGAGLWLGFQVFVNMGVNLGALPTKGLTLPFMSYGGSAVVLNMVMMSVVLRVDYEMRQLMHGGR